MTIKLSSAEQQLYDLIIQYAPIDIPMHRKTQKNQRALKLERLGLIARVWEDVDENGLNVVSYADARSVVGTPAHDIAYAEFMRAAAAPGSRSSGGEEAE